MWLPVAVVVLGSAAPLKVAATRFAVVELSEERANFYTEHFADRLADEGLRVVTPREVSTMLGLERQRALLGCSEESSCAVELAAALGVDALVLGTVAKVGAEYQVSVKIIASEDGRRLAAQSARVKREEQVLEALSAAAANMASQLNAALGREPVSGGARRWWWVPAGVGVLATAGGVVGLLTAEGARARLAGGERLDAAAATQALATGTTARTLGWVGVGVGVVAAGTAVGLLLSGGSSAAVTPVATVGSDGASIGVVGRLP